MTLTRVQPLTSFLICLFYGTMSVILVVHNKYVMTFVPSSNVLIGLQCLLNVAVLLVLRGFRLVAFRIAPFSLGSSFRNSTLVSSFYAVNVLTSCMSLYYISVPAYSALKRCYLIFGLLGEITVLHVVPSTGKLISVLVMFAGTLLSGVFDTAFSAVGYILCLVGCVSAAVSYVLSKKEVLSSRDSTGDLAGTLYRNSAFTLLCLVPLLQMLPHPHDPALSELDLLGEVLLRISSGTSPAVAVQLLINSCAALVLNYSLFLNCNVNSPVAVGVTGNMKAIVTTFAGVAFFGTRILPLGALGLSLNAFGGIMYSYVQYKAIPPSSAAASPADDSKA